MTTMATPRPVRGSRNKAVLAATAVGLAGILLAGCSMPSQRVMVGAIPEDYRTNHPITVSEQLATMDVPVGAETPTLARGMDGNILAFADAFIDARAPELAIVLPSGSANAANAANIAVQVEQVLVAGGVPQAAIGYRAYPATAGETEAPIRLAFVHIAASTAPCGPWSDNVSNTNDNRNYAAFGCATQHNLAAMVSNPLDLLYPRRMSPPDASRRANVLNDYRSNVTNEPFERQELEL